MFEKIYYINLAHRTDRLESIQSVLEGYDAQLVPGFYTPEIKGLGCATSHIRCLKDAIEKGYENCLILEDDFVPVSRAMMEASIDMFLESKMDWDVVMLAGNVWKKKSEGWIDRVYEAQTTSGYAVNRRYYETLLEVFKESETDLFNGKPYHSCAIDQAWKKLQRNAKWYAFNPLVGKQMDGYSDIEGRNVSYGC
jgi:GR25 family glycosyltransferase involved in LPS biosynthesis